VIVRAAARQRLAARQPGGYEDELLELLEPGDPFMCVQ
jgi:hypothetical protein